MFSDAELTAYLEESLPVERMTALEAALRSEPALTARLQQLAARRDAGFHSLGELWRRQRLSCPTREELGSWLLEVLPPERSDYLQFHLETIGCRLCQANAADLREQLAEQAQGKQSHRQRKYFESSVGHLRSS